VFLVESIPPFLEEGEVNLAIEELIAELQGMEKEKRLSEERHRRLAASLSRRVRSRKKNFHLVEAGHLIKQLLQADDAFHCPQGKRTLVCIREREIENDFTKAFSTPPQAFADSHEGCRT
jgi:DNA mismatch repair ATPase MutL